MGYLSNFIVYTLAMVGIIILALFVFKYTTGYKIKNSGTIKGLKVTDTLSLTPRKTLYVIEAEGEKFLIAGDTDRTTLISKLGNKPSLNGRVPDVLEEYTDKNYGISTTKSSPYNSVMKSLAQKMRG